MLGFRVKRTLKLGLKSLWLHRLRSFLTVMGIVFGVCSVIAMLAIGEGASREAQEQIKQLGSHNIIVRSVKPPEDEDAGAGNSRSIRFGLTYSDAERMLTSLPGVDVLVPARILRKKAMRGGRRVDARIVGAVPWAPSVTNLRVKRGRFFSTVEMRSHANVCVLGSDLARELFPIDDPLGKAVRLSGDYYTVIGVMDPVRSLPKAKDAPEVRGSNRDAYIPLTTAQSRFGEMVTTVSSGSSSREQVELHQITVKVKELDDVLRAASALRTLLKRFHKKRDYVIVVPLELLRQAKRTQRIFNIVLGSIAAISLLVGGIGIMNIMLATVTERTREIGIRRAMGAKRRDIIVQFLTETVLLSGGGGVLGVALGVIIPYFVGRFTSLATVVTGWSLALAFFISVAIGVVFGIYPAHRAANMDPIEALRHE